MKENTQTNCNEHCEVKKSKKAFWRHIFLKRIFLKERIQAKIEMAETENICEQHSFD